jgi:CRP-like cAMP-binding protein
MAVPRHVATEPARQVSNRILDALPDEEYPLQREAARGGELRSILNRYTHARLTQVAQASACNRVYTMRQRCARWLLQTHDRVRRDEFPLTQRFLSQMLGVRPPP